jgi:hypothetical protein
VKPPDIDADDAAAEALELYDKDGDGAIDGAELDAVPGIQAAMETIDADKDGRATEEEIVARIERWREYNAGVMAVNCAFTLDGRPLDGAEVTFEPESFLGDEIKSGVGQTASGSVAPSIPKEERPSADMPPGLQMGLYRIRVSKMANGVETIPAKYNSATTLGQQVSPDDPAIAAQRVHFDLTTK